MPRSLRSEFFDKQFEPPTIGFCVSRPGKKLSWDQQLLATHPKLSSTRQMRVETHGKRIPTNFI